MGFRLISDRTESLGGFCCGPEVQIGLAVVSTVFGAIQQEQQASYQAGMAKYNAAVEQDQAKIAENAAISQQNELNYQAANAHTAAGQANAAAEQEAINQKRQTDLVLSRARTVAAAGGGSSTDPSTVDIMGQLATQGKYNEDVALYQGAAKASDLNNAGNLYTMEGSQARAGGTAQAGIDNAAAGAYMSAASEDQSVGGYKAFSTILSGASSIGGSDAFQTMYGKYGSDDGSNAAFMSNFR